MATKKWGSISYSAIVSVLMVLLVAHSATVFSEDGLLNNGDFEAASATDDETTDPVPIPDWKTKGRVEFIESGQKQGGMILIFHQGLRAVRLGNDAEINQELKLEKGSLYSITFSAARTCEHLESVNISVPPASQTIDLQTLYSVHGWDTYAWAFEAQSDEGLVVFRNPGMEEDPTCGPIIDDIAIKKLFTPDKVKNNVVINGDFEEGPWMFRNASLGVLLPTNLDQDTSSLPGWNVESNRTVRYIDSDHFSVPGGKRAVELVSGEEGIISQMVETKPKKQYTLSFSLGRADDKCLGPLAVTAFAGDQPEHIHYFALGATTYITCNRTFTAETDRTRIAFYSIYYNARSDDRSLLCGPVVDNVGVWGLSGSVRRVSSGMKVLVVALALVSLWI